MKRWLLFFGSAVFLFAMTGVDPLGANPGTSHSLNVVLAIDLSGSMKAAKWDAAIGAAFSIIDDLEVGDRTIPVGFGTVARIVADPVVICGGQDRLRLRRVYSDLVADDEWTYYRDLHRLFLRLRREYGRNTALLAITDSESDPGPGRNSDIDISWLASDQKEFAGSIRVLTIDNEEGASGILGRLRSKTSADAPDSDDLEPGRVDSFFQLVKSVSEFLKQQRARSASLYDTTSRGGVAAIGEQPGVDGTEAVERLSQAARTNDKPGAEAGATADGTVTEGSPDGSYPPWLPVAAAAALPAMAALVILRQRRRNNEVATDTLAEESSSLFVAVKDGSLPVLFHPLHEGHGVSIGEDVPVEGATSAILDISMKNGQLFAEPHVTGINVNESSLSDRRKVEFWDVIAYQSLLVKFVDSDDPGVESVINTEESGLNDQERADPLDRDISLL